MDSVALHSFRPFLDGVDSWYALLPLLPILVALEIVLSADNAVALAAITRGLNDSSLQTKALNIGISMALFLRIGLILMAQWILKFWQVKCLASLYLLSLFPLYLLP